MPKVIINGTEVGEKLYAPNRTHGYVLNALGGDDWLYGGYKSTGELRGGEGSNVIFAGYQSKEDMWGGSGPSTFVFANPDQSPDQGDRRATIHDFKPSDRIKIFWATAETCVINWTPIQGGKAWRVTWTYKGSPSGDDNVPDMAVDLLDAAEPTMANFTFGSASEYP